MTTYNLSDATEKHHYIIKLSFLDEDGAAYPLNICEWSMNDGRGNVINSRSSVTCTVTAGIGYIVLSGDDLVYSSAYSPNRVVTFSGTFNNATYGNNLTFNQDIGFNVTDLPNTP